MGRLFHTFIRVFAMLGVVLSVAYLIERYWLFALASIFSALILEFIAEDE